MGGALTEANGGRFSDGFLGAFAASAAGNEIDNHIMAGNESGGAIAARTAAAAALGGTVSKINGGNFANGAWSAAFQHLFNDEGLAEKAINGSPDRNSEGIPISKQEREWAAERDRKDFWKSRLKRGDPLAKTALGIAENNTPEGQFANLLLKAGIEYGGVHVTVDEVGVDLMRAHVRAVDTDYENKIGKVPGALSVRQIRAYHYAVFHNLGIPTWAFGGTPFGFPAWTTSWIYCGRCDTSQ